MRTEKHKKMAPPRFQCLNAGKHLTQRSSSLRAAFSTSRVACAGSSLKSTSLNKTAFSNKSITDEPSPRSSSAADLLASLDAEAPSRKTNPNLYTNPIRTTPRQTSSPPYPSPSTSSPNGHKASAGVLRLLSRANARAQNPQNPQSTTLEDMQKYKLSADLSKQISRRWKAGDVYAPHDLSAVEMGKWKSRGRPTHDVFDVLDFNPLEHYRVLTTSRYPLSTPIPVRE